MELNKLRELAQAATPEAQEWHQEIEHECPWNIVDSNGDQVAITQQRTSHYANPKQTDRTAVARFIAAANPAVVIELIDRLEAAQRLAEFRGEQLVAKGHVSLPAEQAEPLREAGDYLDGLSDHLAWMRGQLPEDFHPWCNQVIMQLRERAKKLKYDN